MEIRVPAHPVKQCTTCGKDYQPNSGRQKYCAACGRRAERTCERCGKVFRMTGNTTGRFCSRDCAYAAKAGPTTEKRPCPQCGTMFKPSSSAQTTCSRACGAIHRKNKRTPRTCIVCGKVFDNKHAQQVTCSKECAGKRRQEPRNTTCERCGKTMPFNRYRQQRFCSPACRATPLGTRTQLANGYVMIRAGKDYPNADIKGWIQEHRYVMAEYLGRPLHTWETVHHIDGDTAHNVLTNLQLRIGNHGKHVAYRCMDCGSNRLEPISLE